MKTPTEYNEERLKDESRKPYHSPQLIEYGVIRELTLGATGPKGDKAEPGRRPD